ncbi:MAG: hypothetical protein K2J70_02465 [Muribaculaceae bacterium]|nr:hypothetical protein [Muribaculaceae bacterium]
MKVTEKLIRRIIGLLEGASIPSSEMKGEWVDTLVQEGVLLRVYSGSRKSYRLKDRAIFLDYMERHNALLRDPYRALELLGSESARSDIAADSGDSKSIKARACPGFAVNSFHPVSGRLDDKEIVINPMDGTFLFICDWKNFSIPEETVVVGVENMENFRKVALQRDLFRACLRVYEETHPGERFSGVGDDCPPLLFVARYPQSNDLVEWLKTINNPYFHFGDFDLEGIRIFQTEFESRLRDGRRILGYLIPPDIEARLANGTRQRYLKQYAYTLNVVSDDPSLGHLISLIRRYRRCYDQEGYIAKPIESGIISSS